MITHIFVDKLGQAELPMYEIPRPCDHYYVFNPGRPSVAEREGCNMMQRIYEGHYWESRMRNQRAFIEHNIDIFVYDAIPQISGWLHQVHEENPEVSGTLIVSIRENTSFIDEGQLLQAGLGFAPIPWGVRLPEDLDPVEALHQIFGTHSPHQMPERHPLIQTLLRDMITDERHKDLLESDYNYIQHRRQIEEEKEVASQRARVLLYSCLTHEQIVELEEHRYFHVWGADERRYRIEDLPQHNVFLMQGDRKVLEFCVVTKVNIPVFDLMLMQKMLLESNPNMFWENANRWTIDLAGERELEYTVPRPPIVNTRNLDRLSLLGDYFNDPAPQLPPARTAPNA